MNAKSFGHQGFNEWLEEDESPLPESASTTTDALALQSKAPLYLRWIGALVLGIATMDFLIQGLRDMAPAYRNWIMPAFDIVLALLGLLCGYVWKETRGARLFFGLATAFLPVQASQLGALIHDHLNGVGAGYRGWLSYAHVGPLVILANLLLTGLVFLPVAHMGFSILAKRQASRLLFILSIGCLLVALPWRDPLATAMLMSAQWLILRGCDRLWFADDESMSTREGSMARLMLWIPLAIVIGRSLFYPVSYVTDSTFLILCGITVINLRRLLKHDSMKAGMDAVGFLLILIGWLTLIDGIVMNGYLAKSEQFLVSYLPLSLMLLTKSGDDGLRSSIRVLGALGVCLSALIGLLDNPGHGYALISILTGIGVGLVGYHRREKAIFGIGLAGFVLGLGYYLRYAVDLYHSNSWLTLALLGVTAILAASFLDRKDKPLAMTLRKFLEHPKGWR